MLMNDYCVFIPTYKRSENVETYKTLRSGGYTGKIYLVVDDKDPELEVYRNKYKDQVLVFSKDEIAKRIDVCDNFSEKNSVIYARNKIPELARDVGVKYYLVLDDDYNRFSYRRCYGDVLRTFRCLQLFNTYGVNMDKNDGRVVSNFINQALNGENITIYGDGRQTRSFCYIDDLVKGLIKMMNSPKEITGPINLGNPSEFTMLELAQLVLKKIKTKSSIVYQDLPQDDPARRKPDITKAIALLGWKPEVNLSEGLDKTISYFREQN